MTATTLRLAHLTSPVDVATAPFTVKSRAKRRVLGATWTFFVIGSSHYVAAPAYDFYELCSCEPIEDSEVESLSLEHGLDRQFTVETGLLSVDVRVEGRPLAAFPGPNDADVAYEFGSQAFTTITVEDDAYRTYHTYPEYDLALYTHNEFSITAGAVTGAESARAGDSGRSAIRRDTNSERPFESESELESESR